MTGSPMASALVLCPEPAKSCDNRDTWRCGPGFSQKTNLEEPNVQLLCTASAPSVRVSPHHSLCCSLALLLPLHCSLSLFFFFFLTVVQTYPPPAIACPPALSRVWPRAGRGDSSGKVAKKKQPLCLKLCFECLEFSQSSWPFDLKPG